MREHLLNDTRLSSGRTSEEGRGNCEVASTVTRLSSGRTPEEGRGNCEVASTVTTLSSVSSLYSLPHL